MRCSKGEVEGAVGGAVEGAIGGALEGEVGGVVGAAVGDAVGRTVLLSFVAGSGSQKSLVRADSVSSLVDSIYTRFVRSTESEVDTEVLLSVCVHCVFQKIAITPVSFVGKRRSWHHSKAQESGFLIDAKHNM